MLKVLVCPKQTKRTKQYDIRATKRRGYRTNGNQENGGNCIRIPQTTSRKTANECGKEKCNNQNKKKHVKEKLHDADVTELSTETSAEEIKEAIKQSQTGKCPGHRGITYEFWKSWKEPKKGNEENNDKKPISISLILQIVFNDIEKHNRR